MTYFDSDETFRVLLVGSGGREHAIARKLAQSSLVEAIFVAPGTRNQLRLANMVRKWRNRSS